MKKIRFFPILLLLCLVFSMTAPSAMALTAPTLDAQAVVLVDLKSGHILYEQNKDEQRAPASLTKIMTVLLALEAIQSGKCTMDDMVTAQEDCREGLGEDSSTAGIAPGDVMSMRDLIYCALISSANEACNVIANYVGGSVSEFVELMNRRAGELGCEHTHFVNTHGLQDSEHYTTARDLSRILRAASGHELIMEISNTVTYTVPDTNMSAERKLENTNSLINPTNPLYPGDYGYDYAKGVKTGHTSDAGYCLATTAEKDGVQLLCVIMKAEAYELEDKSMFYGSFADARTLFMWAFDNFSYQEIVKSTEIITDMPVIMGADAQTVAIRPSTSITAFLPNDVDLDSFERTVTIFPTGGETEGSLNAPVSAGQTVGEISVSLDGKVYGTSPLVTSTSVDLSRVQFMKGQLKETLRRPAVVFTFWALLLLFLTYLGLVIRYRLKRRAYQRRLEDARQIRIDLEGSEEEARYERRSGRSPTPARQELVMEPESYRRREEDAVDEPTRVSGQLPDLPADEPTRRQPDVSGAEGEQVRDYFEEFFSEK